VDLLDLVDRQASVDRPASLVVVDPLVSVAGRRRTTKDHNETSLERFGIGRSNTARAHTTDLRRYLGKRPKSRPTRSKGANAPKIALRSVIAKSTNRAKYQVQKCIEIWLKDMNYTTGLNAFTRISRISPNIRYDCNLSHSSLDVPVF
jgi:hypothetical protein